MFNKCLKLWVFQKQTRKLLWTLDMGIQIWTLRVGGIQFCIFHSCKLSILQKLPYDMKSWKTKRIWRHGMCLVAGYKTMTPNSFCCFSTFHMAYGISYGNFCKMDSSCHGLYLPLLDNIKQLWIWFVIIHKFHCQRISWLIHRFHGIREICCQCWMSNKSSEID